MNYWGLVGSWSLQWVSVSICWRWWSIGCHCSYIWTFLEYQLTNSKKLVSINMSISINICLLKNKQKLSRSISTMITNTLEEIIEKPMQLCWFESSCAIDIVDAPDFINIFSKSYVVHFIYYSNHTNFTFKVRLRCNERSETRLQTMRELETVHKFVLSTKAFVTVYFVLEFLLTIAGAFLKFKKDLWLESLQMIFTNVHNLIYHCFHITIDEKNKWKK